MTTIRVRTHLDSTTVKIPELDSMVGKDVEIVIKEVPTCHPDIQAFIDASKNLPADIDFDAMAKMVNELREISTI